MIEPELESIFLPDGYRPGKSALDAVGVTPQRCWKYDWVLEFDIKGCLTIFRILLKAVRRHAKQMGAVLHQKMADGVNGKGLFLHCTFDCRWRGHIPTSLGVGMPTMDWCTAGRSKKPRPLRRSFNRGWRCADFRCTRQRRRSSIARTTGVGERIRRSSLTFSDISSGRGRWQRHSERISSVGTARQF
jgi:hypothetical protein